MTPIEPFIIAIMAMAPGLPENAARENVEAAMTAAVEQGLPIELLLGMAFTESRYDSSALSRIECNAGVCKRVAGLWTSSQKPPGARPDWYCGVMQVGGNVPWTRCQELRTDLTLNYREGARHLATWMKQKACQRLTGQKQHICALSGYVGGWTAIKYGSKSGYPVRCLRTAAKILRLAEIEAAKSES